MPGEPLVCVWQLAYAKQVQVSKEYVSSQLLHTVIAKFSQLPTVKWSPSEFQTFFKKHKRVKFDLFKEYTHTVLCDDDDTFQLLQEQIEGKCWEEMKSILEPVGTKHKVTSDVTKQLWQIFNRLAVEDSFPVVTRATATDWLGQVITSRLKVTTKEKTDENKYFRFEEFVDRLFAEHVSTIPVKDVTAAIEGVHAWLAEENMKCGWMYKRVRQNANWTNWVKRWVVLTPARISMYREKALSFQQMGREEFPLSAYTVFSLSDNKTAPREYPGRFKLLNPPVFELEFSTENEGDRLEWVHEITRIVDAAKSGTTPVQQLLKAKFTADIERTTVKQLRQKLMDTLNFALNLTYENSVTRAQLAETTVNGTTGDETKSTSSNVSNNMDEQMRAVFMKVDSSGNGKIDFGEFEVFLKSLGLKMDKTEVQAIFDAVDLNKNGSISYDEFADYFADILANKDKGGIGETQLRRAFLQADRDGSGTVGYKEVSDWLLQSQQSICKDKILESVKNAGGEMSLDDFKKLCSTLEGNSAVFKGEAGDVKKLNKVETKLMDFYSSTDGDELSQFISDRWKGFVSFRRKGDSGKVVMTGEDEIVQDFVPGEYSLVDMVCFSDLPPLVPDHTVIKGAQWKSGNVAGKSGKLICPSEFSGEVRISMATNETLRYYGCSFAENNAVTVSLMYRHAIQDFTYESAYLDDYVKKTNGGSGVERHDFIHLDCPMEEDNGFFILGKFVSEDELHITAFQVPARHTLYLPANTIHSNDYLKGVWRTMLSDEANIDHVHLCRAAKNQDQKPEHFTFKFVD